MRIYQSYIFHITHGISCCVLLNVTSRRATWHIDKTHKLVISVQNTTKKSFEALKYKFWTAHMHHLLWAQKLNCRSIVWIPPPASPRVWLYLNCWTSPLITPINPVTFVRDQGFVRLFSSLVISLHLFVQHCGWLTMRKPGVAADSTCTFEGFTIHMGRTKTHKTFQYQQ